MHNLWSGIERTLTSAPHALHTASGAITRHFDPIRVNFITRRTYCRFVGSTPKLVENRFHNQHISYDIQSMSSGHIAI